MREAEDFGFPVRKRDGRWIVAEAFEAEVTFNCGQTSFSDMVSVEEGRDAEEVIDELDEHALNMASNTAEWGWSVP